MGVVEIAFISNSEMTRYGQEAILSVFDAIWCPSPRPISSFLKVINALRHVTNVFTLPAMTKHMQKWGTKPRCSRMHMLMMPKQLWKQADIQELVLQEP